MFWVRARGCKERGWELGVILCDSCIWRKVAYPLSGLIFRVSITHNLEWPSHSKVNHPVLCLRSSNISLDLVGRLSKLIATSNSVRMIDFTRGSMCFGSRDFVNCWQITDNISETVQDKDKVVTEGLWEITCGLSNCTVQWPWVTLRSHQLFDAFQNFMHRKMYRCWCLD